MPGHDRPFNSTEFMTDVQLAEHNERERNNAQALAMLSETNKELIKRLEAKQEQAILERIAKARADERRKVLEEVRQIVTATVDGEPIQPDEIERRIEQLAAQPEEEGE